MKAVEKILDHKILELVDKKGWRGLNPIQVSSINAIKAGKNVLIAAPTGYGKTEAALLPILDSILKERPEPVSLVYITPMKALINDVMNRISWWAEKLGIRVSRKHGDVPQSEKNRRLRYVPDILIITPESLEIDMDWSSRFRSFYSNTRWIIIDEVHEIIFSKRGAQLSLLLERLRLVFGIDPQIIMLSATIGNHRESVGIFLGSSKREFVIVEPKLMKEHEILLEYIGKQYEDGWWRRLAEKIGMLIEPLTIIFTPSRHFAEKLHAELERAGVKGVLVHHSSVSGHTKERIEELLRLGRAKAVITTRTLELGVDIGMAKKAIVVGAPPNRSSLIQKIGRTAHYMGGVSKGIIIALRPLEIPQALAVSDPHASSLDGIKPLRCPLDVIAREAVGIVLGRQDLTPVFLQKLVSGSRLCDHFSIRDADKLLEILESTGILVRRGNAFSIGPSFYKIWRFAGKDGKWWAHNFTEFFTFITDRKAFQVRSGEKTVGELDSLFVYRHLRTGDIIRLGGSSWRIVDIDENNGRIEVVKLKTPETEVPIWHGGQQQLGERITKQTLKTLASFCKDDKSVLPSGVKLENDALISLKDSCEKVKDILEDLAEGNLILSICNDELVLLNPRGMKVNESLGYLLLYKASSKLSLTSYFKASPYGVLLQPPIDFLDIIEGIQSKEQLLIEMEKALSRSPIYYPVLREVKLSFGLIGREAESEVVEREALKQVMERHLDVGGLWTLIKDIRDSHIEVKKLECKRIPDFILDEIRRNPNIRAWLKDLSYAIISTLSDWAFTVDELSEILQVPKKSVEAKLKELRKQGNGERVFRFYDIESGDWRWGLVRDASKIAFSGEFSRSFRPNDPSQLFKISLRDSITSTHISLIASYNTFFSSKESLSKIPFEEIFEMKVEPLSSGLLKSMAPYYYNFPKNILPILLANAIAYLQNMNYY